MYPRNTRKRRMKKYGGRAGKLIRVLNINNASIVGAGGYGVIVHNPKSSEVFKLLYDTDACEALKTEASVQQKAYNILKTTVPEVGVPEITYVSTESIIFQNSYYLCGLGMKYLQPPLDFDETVHMVLGYHQDDIDTSWGKIQSLPVSATNPTRGFFASPETLEWIWEQEKSDMTIEKLAYLMGKTYSILIKHGILPIDVEWIWSEGRPWVIDFGLCEIRTTDTLTALQDKSYRGLQSDFYIPQKGDRGYKEFLVGLI